MNKPGGSEAASKPPSSKLGPRQLSRPAKNVPKQEIDISADHDKVKACGTLDHTSIPPKVFASWRYRIASARRRGYVLFREIHVFSPGGNGGVYIRLRDDVLSSGVAI